MTPKKHTEHSEAPKRPAPRWRLVFLVSVGALIVVLGAFSAYAFAYQDTYLPHTEIGGEKVGNLTKAEAAARLAERQEKFSHQALEFTYEDKKWQVTPGDIGSSFSNEQALDDMWSRQKEGGWQRQLKHLFASLFLPTRAEVGFTAVSEEGEATLSQTVLQQVEVAHQEVGVDITGKGASIIPGKAGRRVNRNDLEVAMYGAYKRQSTAIALQVEDFQPHLTEADAQEALLLAQAIVEQPWKVALGSTSVTLDTDTVAGLLGVEYVKDGQGNATALMLNLKKDAVTGLIEGWSKSVSQSPTNAQLTVVEGVVKVAQEGKDGVKINNDVTEQTIRSQFLNYQTGNSRTITAAVEVDKPAVRSETLESLGLVQKIGTATTDFTGSPTNRKGNIGIGQKKLNGTLVQPGEVYSTIAHLGPITVEAGFLNELVIKNNRTLPEAGGGLCQVSTTLFRSVLSAGLPITERANHSYRVGYYERSVGPGLDATIYDPSPDFKWKNDLTKPIYVQSSLKGDTITFELYGTNDGRVSTIGKPVILEETPPGDPIYIQTDTLLVGQQKQVETPHPGAKTTVDYVVMRDGKEINKQTFRSTYKPWPAQYYVGTRTE